MNNKMNDFVGNILQNKFYSCCCILLSGTRHKRRWTSICGAALRLWCNWCRNLAAVNCIVHWIGLTPSTLQMGITLVMVVAYYCYGYNTTQKRISQQSPICWADDILNKICFVVTIF